jgi:hypothetical protein
MTAELNEMAKKWHSTHSKLLPKIVSWAFGLHDQLDRLQGSTQRPKREEKSLTKYISLPQ